MKNLTNKKLEKETLSQYCPNPRKAVDIIAKCSRAVLLAHFDSAEQNETQLGALNEHLKLRKIDEKVSDGEWSTYVSLWNRITNGAFLSKNDKETHFVTRQNKYGKNVKSRPSIYEILILLLGDFIPANLITDWYRMELCDRHSLTNSLEFNVYLLKLLENYNNINSSTLDRKKLLQIFYYDDDKEKEKLANGLIEVLEFLAILQFDSNNFKGYRIKFKAEPEFVLTNTFGRSTGIDGLDYLFYGGIRTAETIRTPNGPCKRAIEKAPLSARVTQMELENLSILISGSPGMGKSTLALSMAVQTAARGGLCIFFLFEPSTHVMTQKIAQFFRKLHPYVRISSQESGEISFGHNGTNDSKKGLLFFSDISKTPFQQIEDTSVELARKFMDNHFAERMIVFDSISASEDYGKDPGKWRSFLFQITSLLNEMGYRVVHILERSIGTKDSVEDYLVDIDIRLTEQSNSYAPYPFRKLEIVKARGQIHHRGPHIISIKPDRGLSVYPSSTAVMGARRRRESRIRYQPNLLINPGVEGFANYFTKINKSPEQESSFVNWWTEGSVTALIGPRGTLKAVFCEVFASTSNDQYDFVPSALSLHFADDYPSSRIQLKKEDQKPVLYGFRYDYTSRHPAKTGSPIITYILFRSGYLAPGHVLQLVRDFIVEKRKNHGLIKRAVISDLGNIIADFPSLKEDPVFIPALCELLTSEGITTLLVYSQPKHGGQDFVIDQIRSVSENIIKFEPVVYAGRTLTAMSVERSGDSSHNTGIFELRESLSERVNPILEVTPTFDLFVDVHKGTPKPVLIKILLQADTDLQFNYHNEMRKLHVSLGSYDIQIRGHAFEFAKHALSRHVSVSEKALWLVQIDSSEIVNQFSPKESNEVLFCDLAPYVKHFEKRFENLVLHYPNPRKTNRPLLSIPYFLNPSLLVVRNEFRDFVLATNKWQRIGLCEGDYSWTELIEAASEFLKVSNNTNPKWGDYSIFDCPFETTEPLNCLFLEILYSLSKVNFDKLNLFNSFGEKSPFRIGKRDLLVETVLILKQLLGQTYDNHKSHNIRRRKKMMSLNNYFMGQGDEYARPYVTEKAVIWRHWYNTFRQMAADMSLGDCRENPGLSLIRLPGGVSTNGDWHFAIIKDSVGIRKGVEILFDEFINKESAITLLSQGVGLPPFRDFYHKQDTEFELPVSGVSANWFQPYVEGKNVIHRSNIEYYKTVKFYLNGALASMVSLKVKDNQLKEEIEKRFKALDQLLKTSILN